MRTSSYILIHFVILVLSANFLTSYSQEKEAIKERAEKELHKMTPEQVDAKIKEMGMTRAEAEAKAKEYGIDLEQYLSTQSSAIESRQKIDPSSLRPSDSLHAFGSQSTQSVPLLDGQILSSPNSKPVPPILGNTIPGFEGRKNAEDLNVFAYTIFNYPMSTFEPIGNMPTPQNYILGPGDEVILTMWGEIQLFDRFSVNPDGAIIIPNVGPIIVQGLTVEQLKTRLLVRLTSVYSGLRGGGAGANTWMDVSIGKIRSIQIFVLGEVQKPGGYTVSSMSTGLLGLYVANGPTSNGSLREIQIIRDNKLKTTIDFYDFALRGDKTKDIRLQDGDVIYVKPVGKRVALTGRINRPAIYELKSGETLGDLIGIAGGLQFTTYTDRVHIERIIPFPERKKFKKNILDLDVKFQSVEELQQSKFVIEDGDIVSVMKINELYQNRVSISGNVKKPGTFELSEKMRVRDLILQADGYLSDTFEERGNILRILADQRKEIISFDLSKAMNGDSLDNVLLESGDEVTIFNKKYFFQEHPVTIGGAVRRPGTILRTEKLSISDLLVLAGGLAENANAGEVIVTRIDTTSETVYSKSYTVSIPLKYWQKDQQNDFELMDYDYVFVPTNPNFHSMKLVSIQGEVMYPGTYGILTEGERLASLINRAGGIKKNAYIEGARLVRTYGGAGLVPVNFLNALNDESNKDNIELVEGDQIIIEKNPHVVYVRGEVGVPSAVVYEEGAGLQYYLNQAGGIKETGDASKAVVIQPNGRKWTSSWFFEPDNEILAGATITVPIKVEHEDKTLPIMRDWATIFASLATMMVVIVQISK